ncbi:30S ribosome-binding factor RbfA [Nesterenkonia massiliensis]|uniref:Ribosome-binding factor A n=1 Tax=Nesterenkonia massiliensis TaxID=1232429 RepID=A0ABT2HMH6_9MICC|nr:30S ribosome-binding factor RbfA [Nesterenkonia massiliensis]MCT1605893.1 30S ribosome-binding factor RbfA [Nesterenkonia massiliensis]
MADSARASRLAARIKVIVAEALRRRVKDERAEMITITDARVTNDLQHATIYYTVLAEDDAAKAGAEEVLAANQGALRHEVGRQLSIRLTPTLEFIADEIPESAAHLEDILRKAREEDERVRNLRGDADPLATDAYRSQGEPENEDR